MPSQPDASQVRVESVCSRLGLTPLCYLWEREQEGLLKEMIDNNLSAILIKTATLGLDPRKHLGLRYPPRDLLPPPN